jgi:hypothetical protein
MTAPAVDAVAALRAYVEPYIDRARDASEEECRQLAAHFMRLADLARLTHDAHAEVLHLRVAALFDAHAVESVRARLIAEHGHDPLEER